MGKGAAVRARLSLCSKAPVLNFEFGDGKRAGLALQRLVYGTRHIHIHTHVSASTGLLGCLHGFASSCSCSSHSTVQRIFKYLLCSKNRILSRIRYASGLRAIVNTLCVLGLPICALLNATSTSTPPGGWGSPPTHYPRNRQLLSPPGHLAQPSRNARLTVAQWSARWSPRQTRNCTRGTQSFIQQTFIQGKPRWTIWGLRRGLGLSLWCITTPVMGLHKGDVIITTSCKVTPSVPRRMTLRTLQTASHRPLVVAPTLTLTLTPLPLVC